jgi:hypothetical protein
MVTAFAALTLVGGGWWYTVQSRMDAEAAAQAREFEAESLRTRKLLDETKEWIRREHEAKALREERDREAERVRLRIVEARLEAVEAELKKRDEAASGDGASRN